MLFIAGCCRNEDDDSFNEVIFTREDCQGLLPGMLVHVDAEGEFQMDSSDGNTPYVSKNISCARIIAKRPYLRS